MKENGNQQMHQQEIRKKLWAIADDTRELNGNTANDVRDYILGLIFYKYLSEKVEREVEKALKNDGISFIDAWNDKEYQEELIFEITKDTGIGYIIPPEFLYSNFVSKINSGQFTVEDLQKGINAVVESTQGKESQEDFDNLFDDMDLTNTRLGRTVKDRTKFIERMLVKINSVDFRLEDTEIDVLGDAYEYLISMFAASAGKKAGEFYTPQQVSTILAKIVSKGKTKLKNVYDPTCGSGSLLLRVAKESDVNKFYGQELNTTTYNLARMNMLLHNVKYDKFEIKNGNTLEEPMHDLNKRFDAIVANPPFSANWSAEKKFLIDERYSNYGKLAPKSKADFAFVQHMIHHLSDNGTLAVVLPHGVLFRGAAEGHIRKYLIQEKNYLDAVIGLPANIFYGTSIPTCILIFKKCKENDDVFFIDASKEFEKQKNQNVMKPEHIEKILDVYEKREFVDKYAYKAELSEIEENDYNLNIPRYVDTFEEEEPIDLKEVMSEIKKIDKEIEETTKELNVYLKELGLEEL